MLKQLYKTFLISILCGSILMLDMSVKSGTLYVHVNRAQAETLQTGAEGADKTGLMTSLEMLAIGLMSSRLMLYGKITLDMGVAAAGGLAFIAGEVIAQQKLKQSAKNIETNINRNKNGKIEDNQLDSLVNLRQSYNDARDTAETKKTLQLAAAAAFVVAAGISYFYTAKDYAAVSACLAADPLFVPAVIEAESVCIGKCNVAAAACAPACSAIATTCSEAWPEWHASLAAYLSARETPSPSCTALSTTNTTRGTEETELKVGLPAKCTMEFLSAASLTNSACAGMSPAHLLSESGCIPAGLTTQIVSFVPLLATMGISNGMGGMVAGGIVGAVMMLATSLAPTIDINILVPQRRAIIWALMGAGAWAASSSTDEQIKKLEGEIKKIDDLVNTVQKQSNSVTLANSLHAKNQNNLNNAGLTLNAVASNDTTIEGASLPCITKPGATGKDCPSASSQILNLPGLSNLPAGLQADVKSIASMSDGLNGSNKVSSSTMSSASNIAANAVAIKKRVADLKKDALSAISKSGSKFNLEDEEKKANESVMKNFNSELAKKNISMGSLLASLGNTGINAVLNKEVSKDGKVTNKAFKASDFAVPAFTIPTAPKMVEIKEEKKAEPVVEAKAANATSIDEYDMKNDINTDKSTSIFEVISRRYEKSGYPRLFKRLNE